MFVFVLFMIVIGSAIFPAGEIEEYVMPTLQAAGHSTLHLPNPSCFRLNIEFLFGKKPKTNHKGDQAGWFE